MVPVLIFIFKPFGKEFKKLVGHPDSFPMVFSDAENESFNG